MLQSKMTSNPSFVEPTGLIIPGGEGPVPPSRRRSPFLKVSKSMMAGFGCAVAAIAFAGGYYVGPGASSSAVDSDADVGGAGDPDAAMEASLDEMVLGNPLLLNLTDANIDGIIDEYLADPEAYEDAFIPSEFAAILSKMAVEEGYEPGGDEPAGDEPAGDRRRLGAKQPALEEYRELTTASALSKDAWNKIQSGFYPDPVTWSGDRVTVYQEGGRWGRCWIIAEESQSPLTSGGLTDWVNNLDLGEEDIQSMKQYNRRDSSCGCEVKKWWQWWCQRYRQCAGSIVIGKGSDASVKPYNNMRIGIISRIEQKCPSTRNYVFAGYSRGGGIGSVIAFAMWKENLLPASTMRLVTFGT